MIFLYIFIGLLVGFGIFYKFIFLRDNKNQIPEGDDIIVSPASGRVIGIQEVSKTTAIEIRKGFFGKIETELEKNQTYWLINIFMSPLDVHINKMPLAGTVKNISHGKGKFLAVNTVEAGMVNEKQEYLLETKIGLVKVIQIAGFLARRTRSYVKVGDSLEKGKPFGVILLGSQVALLLPQKKCEINIQVGDRVSSGETVVGKVV